MATESPEAYLTRNNYAFKKRGNELALANCPACDRADKCSINRMTWAFQCFVCGVSGREYKLKELFGDVYEHSAINEDAESVEIDIKIEPTRKGALLATEHAANELWENPDAQLARDYLAARGLSRSTLEACGAGWSDVSLGGGVASDGGWIVIPSAVGWKSGGIDHAKIAMLKMRSVPPTKKQYIRQAGGHTRLFQPTKVDPKKTVIVCAGELDAMSVIEAGYSNVVATTSGEGAWSDVFGKQLQDCERVVVVYDNDRTGYEGAKLVAAALGDYRCAIYRLPKAYNDLNDALVGGWLRENIHSIVTSKIGIEQKLVRPSDLLHLVTSDEYASAGFSTGWKDLDGLIGGIRQGELIIVTGETGTGKSTWTSNLAVNIARQDVPVLFMPLEIGAVRQSEKWSMQIGGQDPSDMTDGQLDELAFDMDSIPLYLLDQFGSVDAEALRNTVALARHKLGIKVLVIDHIHFSAATDPDRERLQLEQLVMACNEIAVEQRIAVIAVAHPNNRGASDGDGRVVQLGDLKGSSTIKQTAHLALTVWRNRTRERKQDMDAHGRTRSVIYSMKARSTRANEGSVPLMFDRTSQTFHSVDDAPPAKSSNSFDLDLDFDL